MRGMTFHGRPRRCRCRSRCVSARSRCWCPAPRYRLWCRRRTTNVEVPVVDGLFPSLIIHQKLGPHRLKDVAVEGDGRGALLLVKGPHVEHFPPLLRDEDRSQVLVVGCAWSVAEEDLVVASGLLHECCALTYSRVVWSPHCVHEHMHHFELALRHVEVHRELDGFGVDHIEKRVKIPSSS
jgi:hypothetical protein